MLRRIRLTGTRPETDALYVSVTVGVDPRVSARRRVVAGSGRPVAVNANDFAAQPRQILRQRGIVVVAGGDVEEVIGSESDPTTAVRARGPNCICDVFVSEVGDDIRAI